MKKLAARCYLFPSHRLIPVMKAIFLTLLTAPLAFANPIQPETIPASANWYLHGDFTKMRETITGGLLIKFVRQEQAAALAEIENIFEFDPLNDIDDLTLFGTGKKDEGVVTIRGNFDRGHLEKVIVNADNYRTTNHSSTTIHHWEDKGKTQHAAFQGKKTLIISQQEELLKLALDVLAKEQPGLPADFALPTANPAIVAFANISKIDMPDDEGSRIIRRANSLLVTLGEKEERLQASMVADTDSPQTSRRMLEIMEGLVALGQLAEERIEELEIKHGGKTDGKIMTMSMSLSATKALELISQMK